MKQRLSMKTFHGMPDNAVKTQIWTAIAVYVQVAIVCIRLGLKLATPLDTTNSECRLVQGSPTDSYTYANCSAIRAPRHL